MILKILTDNILKKFKIKYLLFVTLLVLAYLTTIPIFFWLSPDVELKTDKEAYLHYDYVYVYACPKFRNIPKKLSLQKLTVLFYKDDVLIPTVGNRKSLSLDYDKTMKTWRGKWPVPWNAQEGNYQIKISTSNITENYKLTTNKCRFQIIRRKPLEMPFPVTAITMESMKPLRSIRFPSVNGSTGSWKELFNWADYAGVNTFFYLCGQTSAYFRKMDPVFPWNKDNIQILAELVEEAHRRQIKFGAWVAAYLTFGPRELAADYEYAWDYDTAVRSIFKDRGISLSDDKRVTDIIKFIKAITKNAPGIDYIGLDYIRNANGGFEMVDEFVSDMKVEQLPYGWEKFTAQQRMCWLGSLVYARRKADMPVIDLWNWWRARKTALIVKKIKEEAVFNKPFWVFTLSWQKGWQHGQDVVMMNDAGADFVTLMIYECDREQFNNLMKDWHAYLSRKDARLIIGNQVDWVVHQKTINPAGPEEYYNRMFTAINGLYMDGTTYGVFLHDISRVFWGRKGPYSPMEWLIAGSSAISKVREIYREIPFKSALSAQEPVEFNKAFEVQLKLLNIEKGSCVSDIETIFLLSDGVALLSPSAVYIDSPDTNFVAGFSVKINRYIYEKGLRYMLSTRTSWKENKKSSPKYVDFNFKYINLVHE